MAKRPKYGLEDFPEPGSIFVAPMADGRLCAGRVLRRQFEGGANAALVIGSRWIGTTIPSVTATELQETLILNHHLWNHKPNVFWTWDLLPADFKLIGKTDLSSEDMAIECLSYTGWQSVPGHALLQWRWEHDRDALLREEAEEHARAVEERKRRVEKRTQYLDSLTLESLADREWLPTWDSESVPPSVECRNILAKLVGEIRALPELKIGSVRKLLKKSVEEFNRLDAKRQFIDTAEREDICESFEQIACAARFPQLVDQIDQWRNW